MGFFNPENVSICSSVDQNKQDQKSIDLAIETNEKKKKEE